MCTRVWYERLCLCEEETGIDAPPGADKDEFACKEGATLCSTGGSQQLSTLRIAPYSREVTYLDHLATFKHDF